METSPAYDVTSSEARLTVDWQELPPPGMGQVVSLLREILEEIRDFKTLYAATTEDAVEVGGQVPVDLLDLYRSSRAVSAEAAACDAAYDGWLRHYALAGDLLAYGAYVHGPDATELAHLAYSRHALVMAGDCEASPLSLHVLPPEHGKTALTRWEIELWLGRETARAFENPRARVPSAHYIMNTAGQAEKQVMEIEGTIERNRRYKALFPMVRPDKRLGWTKDHFFLDRPRSRPDPSLQGCGMFGPIQGSRAGFQAVDDPTDQQDARSDGLLDSQAQWLAGTAADRLIKGGIRRYRMTRWSEKDSFSRLSKVKGMVVRVSPALDGTGRALWPEVWPADRLEAKRQELIDQGMAALWQLAYLCNPTAATGGMIKRDWFGYGPNPLARAREEMTA